MHLRLISEYLYALLMQCHQRVRPMDETRTLVTVRVSLAIGTERTSGKTESANLAT